MIQEFYKIMVMQSEVVQHYTFLSRRAGGGGGNQGQNSAPTVGGGRGSAGQLCYFTTTLSRLTLYNHTHWEIMELAVTLAKSGQAGNATTFTNFLTAPGEMGTEVEIEVQTQVVADQTLVKVYRL